MAGPSQASEPRRLDRSAPIVASSTPALQAAPAGVGRCDHGAVALANSTGRQSATWIASTRPRCRAMAASAVTGAASRVGIGHARAVHLLSHQGSPGRESGAHARRRFSATAGGRIAHVRAEIEAREGCRAHAPGRAA